MTHNQKTIAAKDFVALIKAGIYDFSSYARTKVEGLVILPLQVVKDSDRPDLNLGALVFNHEVKFSRSRWKKVVTHGARFEGGINLGASRIDRIHFHDSSVKYIIRRTLNPEKVRSPHKNERRSQRSSIRKLGCSYLHVTGTTIDFVHGRAINQFICDGGSRITEVHTDDMSVLRLYDASISILNLDQNVRTVHLEHGFECQTVHARLNQKAGYLIAFFKLTGVSMGTYPEELLQPKIVERSVHVRHVEQAPSRSREASHFDRTIRMFDPGGLPAVPRFQKR